MKFFGAKKFFSYILISEIGLKMIFKIASKNHAADPEIGFITKSILMLFGRTVVMLTVLEYLSV